jgi:hypothetical protein
MGMGYWLSAVGCRAMERRARRVAFIVEILVLALLALIPAGFVGHLMGFQNIDAEADGTGSFPLSSRWLLAGVAAGCLVPAWVAYGSGVTRGLTRRCLRMLIIGCNSALVAYGLLLIFVGNGVDARASGVAIAAVATLALRSTLLSGVLLSPAADSRQPAAGHSS